MVWVQSMHSAFGAGMRLRVFCRCVDPGSVEGFWAKRKLRDSGKWCLHGDGDSVI